MSSVRLSPAFKSLLRVRSETGTNSRRSNRGLSGPTDSEDLINLVVFTGKCLAGNAGETRVTR